MTPDVRVRTMPSCTPVFSAVGYPHTSSWAKQFVSPVGGGAVGLGDGLRLGDKLGDTDGDTGGLETGGSVVALGLGDADGWTLGEELGEGEAAVSRSMMTCWSAIQTLARLRCPLDVAPAKRTRQFACCTWASSSPASPASAVDAPAVEAIAARVSRPAAMLAAVALRMAAVLMGVAPWM